MNVWIIYIPIIISVGTLAVALWSASHAAKKDKVEEKTSETDEYIKALNGRLDIMTQNLNDLDKRMILCELARADLAKQNVELQKEKIDLLTQLVSAGVMANINKAK